MFGTTHVLVGIVLSQTTSNLPAVFGLTFLSHVFLDFIPHGDNLIVQEKGNKEKIPSFESASSSSALKKLIRYAIVDGIILIGIFFYLLFVVKLNPVKTLVAIIGAMLLDGIATLYKITKWDLLRKMEKFHYWIHQIITRHLPKGDIPPSVSIGLQIVFAVVVLWTLST